MLYVEKQAPVVEKLENASHWINVYPVVNIIGSLPLDSDYSFRFTCNEVPKKTVSRFFNSLLELVSKVLSIQLERKPKNQ